MVPCLVKNLKLWVSQAKYAKQGEERPGEAAPASRLEGKSQQGIETAKEVQKRVCTVKAGV